MDSDPNRGSLTELLDYIIALDERDSAQLLADQNEIPLTPEMVAAGKSVLCAFDPDLENEADGAARIYRAMERARIDVARHD